MREQNLSAGCSRYCWPGILMRYHSIIEEEAPRGWCRSGRRSTEIVPSSSDGDRLDWRVLAATPGARGASRWSCRWGAPGPPASRCRAGTCPGRSAAISPPCSPTPLPILAASCRTRTARCLPHFRSDWISTPWSSRSRESTVNLFYQQEHFWIPALAFCCKFLSLVFRVEQLSIKFSLCVELLQLQCSFIDFARTAAAQTGQSSRPWAPCHAPPLTAPSSWSRLLSLLLLPFFSSSSGPAGCGQGPRRKHATVTNTHWVMQQANCSFVLYLL